MKIINYEKKEMIQLKKIKKICLIKNKKYVLYVRKRFVWWWWWWWWWWIAFVVWLTDERHLVLFQAGTIVRDPHYHESPTCREQGLNLPRTWVLKFCNSNNHDTMAPRVDVHVWKNIMKIINTEERLKISLITQEKFRGTAHSVWNLK